LGMYVEVEAPFCWVGQRDDMGCLRQILTPTSAMVDYCHAHPSVIIWSLANESHFSEVFEISNRLVKNLDSTRPTTFNNPDPQGICDIENYHYPPMPWHEQFKDRLRPILFGEYWFPVCHEQIDVMINPGLREYFGLGHADPNSEFGKAVAAEYDLPVMKPCAKPGAWSGIYHSEHIIGGAIWASHDDAFYFPDGRYCGYAWHHGFWGLIDVWRRQKPEWYLARLIFSPVWFPVTQVDYIPGQESVHIPVENRYSFTNLSELKITWEIGGKLGNVKSAIPPSSIGEIEVPIPKGTPAGECVILRVTDKKGNLINVRSIQLGEVKPKPVPMPKAGLHEWKDDGKTITVSGRGFSLVLDRATGNFSVNDRRHNAPIIAFPSLHLTRYDFGDLAGPNSPPYAVFPESKTRVVDKISVEETPDGLRLTVHDSYEGFRGWTSWLVDREGLGRIAYEYTYFGDDMNTRELGIKLILKPEYDEVKWRRWSEWGNVFPKESILRIEGSAKARRDLRWGEEAWNKKPAWPWSLDQTELGTADFRSVKFNIYEASLESPDGRGVKVYANANVHVRPALSKDGVYLHILSRCPLGQVLLRKGDLLSGEYIVEILK
ncbi:MAG: glycoside hydrolase family 2 TIM barrel-domain containing protein, partial [Armatimonadota bacterium]|nr:glycoside hydrolase family 2 TIM barrel-domain containing protein [Armatimonadota bacterium]